MIPKIWQTINNLTYCKIILYKFAMSLVKSDILPGLSLSNIFAALAIPDYAQHISALLKSGTGRLYSAQDSYEIPESKLNPKCEEKLRKTFYKTIVTNEQLLNMLKWHKEKEGHYPTRRDKTPVWIKRDNSWTQTEDSWRNLDDMLRLRTRGVQIEESSLRDFKIAHRCHDTPVITSGRLHSLMLWHKEKEGRYPNRYATTPVWLKTNDGKWIQDNDSWAKIAHDIRERRSRVYLDSPTLAEFKKTHGYISESDKPGRRPKVPALT